MVERKVAESETEGGGGRETVERKRGGGTEMTRERVLRGRVNLVLAGSLPLNPSPAHILTLQFCQFKASPNLMLYTINNKILVCLLCASNR